jgi:hypothetical protein
MPPTIPPALGSYLESSLASLHGQTLITSELSTPSQWLLVRFVYAALYGAGDDPEARQLDAGTDGVRVGERPVVFVSLLRPLSLWIEMGKKMVCSVCYVGVPALQAGFPSCRTRF